MPSHYWATNFLLNTTLREVCTISSHFSKTNQQLRKYTKPP